MTLEILQTLSCELVFVSTATSSEGTMSEQLSLQEYRLSFGGKRMKIKLCYSKQCLCACAKKYK